MAEDFKVLMIRENFKSVGTSFEIVSPFLQSFDDGQEFTIIDVIVAFSLNKRLRHEGDWMPKSIGTGLRQNSATSVLGRVAFKTKGGQGIWLDEDGSFEEAGFESIEGELFINRPFPRRGLFG